MIEKYRIAVFVEDETAAQGAVSFFEECVKERNDSIHDTNKNIMEMHCFWCSESSGPGYWAAFTPVNGLSGTSACISFV